MAKNHKIISSILFNYYTLEDFLCFDNPNQVIYKQLLNDLDFKSNQDNPSVYKSDTIKQVYIKLCDQNLQIHRNLSLGNNETQTLEFVNLHGINDYMNSFKNIVSFIFNSRKIHK
jgi:hypothetical protein